MALEVKDGNRNYLAVSMLKEIYEARKDVKSYVALCEVLGEVTPDDCESLAKICIKRRRHAEALEWVEKGLELNKEERFKMRTGWELPKLQRDLLQALGRGGDAFDLAWEDFQRSPSVYTYSILQKFVKKSQRAEWKGKVLKALASAGLSHRIGVLVTMKEWDCVAIELATAPRRELGRLDYFGIPPIAEHFRESRPELAAKLYIALAEEILDRKRSKHYEVALHHLEFAHKLLQKAGREKEWEDFVQEIRGTHWLKSAFMPRFERLVAGISIVKPTLKDRALKRWGKDSGGEKK
jgi:uncharacterized Zn finger protein